MHTFEVFEVVFTLSNLSCLHVAHFESPAELLALQNTQLQVGPVWPTRLGDDEDDDNDTDFMLAEVALASSNFSCLQVVQDFTAPELLRLQYTQFQGGPAAIDKSATEPPEILVDEAATVTAIHPFTINSAYA